MFRNPPSPTVVAYQPAGRDSGRGQQLHRAYFDLSLIPPPHAWLEERLGPLAHFEVVELASAARTQPAQSDAVIATLNRLFDQAPNSEVQPGTIVVKTAERKLYLVLGDGTAWLRQVPHRAGRFRYTDGLVRAPRKDQDGAFRGATRTLHNLVTGGLYAPALSSRPHMRTALRKAPLRPRS